MGDIPKYLDKYQELCSEQLTYLSQRMAHRIALDKEIDELFEKAQQDYNYVHNILERAREEDNAPKSVNPKTASAVNRGPSGATQPVPSSR